MNRIPPSLSYLTIYNPTLRVQAGQDGDDEDAEEQAHILFYTGKERAVSRDRMLRQVGLAKALISFSGLFNADDPCNNVHSQSKRLVMISPEPGFWIHAGIDLAKVLRVPDPKAKNKSGGKAADKGKEKSDNTAVYDYDDGTVFDHVLREHILQGYQRFKLTHGSFSQILEQLGQQALELQLERFWTPWAWSWDLDSAPDFEQYFGPALHPHFAQLTPIVGDFDDRLSRSYCSVVFTKGHIIPSTRYTEQRYPAALASHLWSLIPPPVDPSPSSDTLNTLASSVDTIRALSAAQPPGRGNDGPGNSNNTFLGMPAMNMDLKWGWPEYLKFGKGNTVRSPTKGEKQTAGGEKADQPPGDQKEDDDSRPSRLDVTVNQDDLQDAMTSDSMSVTSRKRSGSVNSAMDDVDDETTIHHSAAADLEETSSVDVPPPVSSPSPPPLPEFSMTRVQLAPADNEINTRPVSVYYFTAGTMLLALIASFDGEVTQETEATDLRIASEGVLDLIDELERVVALGDQELLADNYPSANKILQPQDRHLISSGAYSYQSPNFSSKSSHLFNTKATLDLDRGIREVFSRGQNPQHWHIARRGLGGSNDSADHDSKAPEGEVFLEVFRKETSLTDVDNILSSVSRRPGIADVGLGLI